MSNRIKSLNFNDEVQESVNWTIPTFNGSGSFIDKWNNFKPLLEEAKRAGKAIKNTDTLITTFPLFHPYRGGYPYHYRGGVLTPNGDLHFVPFSSFVGEKINIYTDQVSTYALIYTADYAYCGGILAPDGSVHFIPWDAPVGQKINPNGTVSTYSLPSHSGFSGGVLSPNGDYIYFAPRSNGFGLKVNVSTNQAVSFNLSAGRYSSGAVITKEGLICFIGGFAFTNTSTLLNPSNDTWTEVNTIVEGFSGVLDLDGNIHMVPKTPYLNSRGSKLNTSTNVVTTYSIPSTSLNFGIGGTLSPDGSIIFATEQMDEQYNVKIYDDIAYTYPLNAFNLLDSSNAYFSAGAVLAPNGSIYFIPQSSVGSSGVASYKMNLATGVTFGMSVCLSPFYNKF